MRTEWIQIIVASIILLAGAIDDLRSRKVHNSLILIAAGAALISAALLGGLVGVLQGFLGLSMAFAVCWPLVVIGIIGAGDMKLLMAFGLATTWIASFQVIVFALIWGAIFGVILAILKGEALQVLKNLKAIVLRQTGGQPISIHKIPFTIALIFGWLSFLKYDGVRL